MKLILTLLFIAFGFFAYAESNSTAQVIEIKVTEQGFEPAQIEASSNSPVILKVTRTTDATCATSIKIKSKKINKDLPLNQSVQIELGKLKKGNLGFTCGMDMLEGSVNVK